MRIHHLIPTIETKGEDRTMIQALQQEVASLKSALQKLTHTPKLIHIRAGNKVNMISPATILYIQADSNYSTIYLRDGKSLFTSKTLKHWTEEINDLSFERIHKSTLINTNGLSSVCKSEGVSTYIFDDGSSVSCNQRSRYSKVQEVPLCSRLYRTEHSHQLK